MTICKTLPSSGSVKKISFKIVEGEGVGPIAQTRSQKIGAPCPDFPSPRLANRTYTVALHNFITYFECRWWGGAAQGSYAGSRAENKFTAPRGRRFRAMHACHGSRLKFEILNRQAIRNLDMQQLEFDPESTRARRCCKFTAPDPQIHEKVWI